MSRCEVGSKSDEPCFGLACWFVESRGGGYEACEACAKDALRNDRVVTGLVDGEPMTIADGELAVAS